MKKVLFADEIAVGMLDELKPETVKEASANLIQAVDYLNLACEILDESGFVVQANELLNILCKLGHKEKDFTQVSFTHESPFKALMDAGISHQDIIEFTKGNKLAKAKFNKKLRELGYSESDIKRLLGKHHMLPQETDELLSPERSFTKIDEFLKDPLLVAPSKPNLDPGDEFNISSLASHKKNKNPLRIHDPHTKGLTPEKMVKNLLHHGTEFNMADDGTASDLLNLEVSDDDLSSPEEKNISEMDFEDEI